MNIRNCDIRKVNTLTKYPSIPTYHEMQGGVLGDNHIALPDEVLITEKVDGANARIILTPDYEYIIGSRDDLFYGRNDIVVNYSLGIVEVLRPIAERALDDIGLQRLQALDGRHYHQRACFTVLYFEVFGTKGAGNPLSYTERNTPSCRLFDIAEIDEQHLAWPIEQISAWREHGGQRFLYEEMLLGCANVYGIKITPRLTVSGPPDGIAETHEWLKNTIPQTLCRIDDTGRGLAEGVVVRSPDRKTIVKLRFEDYHKTLRKRNT